MTRARLPDVETLACAVAGEYAARWARSAARMQDRADDAPGAWLVDGFAGADLQRAAMRGASIQAPAAAFVRAAREALGDAARVVLVEEDPGLLARLENDLRAAGAEPRRASHPADAAPGEIVLVEASFASVASRLAGEVADAPALVRLAPLTARALPWTTVELLADLSDADLLLRFPQEDFARAGKFGGPLADFPPHLRRVVEGCSAFFADERHGWLLAWRDAARAGGDEAALAGAVERLRAMLGSGGEERMARAARLEGAGGGAVHVLLSTPHPAHAQELDGAVTDAGAPSPAPPKAARAGRKSAAAAAPEKPAAAPSPEVEPVPASADPSPPATPAETTEDASEPTGAATSLETAPGIASDAGASAESAEAVQATVEPAPASPAEPAPSSARTARPAPAAAPPPTAEPGSPAAARSAASVPRVPAEPAPEPPTLLDLFALEPAPAAPEPPRGPDLRAIADDLHERRVEQRVPFRELLIELADAGLAPEQVRAALGILKRDRRAAYRSLDADGAEVEFLAAPAAPPPVPAPRPKKARKPVPGVLGLFDEPEGETPASPDDGVDALEASEATDPEPAAGTESEPSATPGKKPRRRKPE